MLGMEHCVGIVPFFPYESFIVRVVFSEIVADDALFRPLPKLAQTCENGGIPKGLKPLECRCQPDE